MSALGKRTKRSDPTSNQVIINAGGTKSHTCTSTLTNSSTYFASRLSDRWREGRNDDTSNGGVSEEFLDMDPAQFTILLSYMRRGRIDADLITPELLFDAQFLGMDRLIQDAHILARREAFEGNRDGKVLRAVEALGLPKCSNVAKDYAEMVIFSPACASFEDDLTIVREPKFFEKDLLTLIEAPKECGGTWLYSDEDPETKLTGLVPNVATIVDGLNWLHKNGFTRLEHDASDDENYHSLRFSRLLENEEDSGSIVHRGIAGANKPKKFAMSLAYEISREGRSKKYNLFADTGQVIKDRTGRLRSVHDYGCETRAARIDVIADHFHVLTWLQNNCFNTACREEALEKAIERAYSEVVVREFDHRPVKVLVWSCSKDDE